MLWISCREVDGPVGKDHDRPPGAGHLLAEEIQEDGGEPAGIEPGVRIELRLGEDQRQFRGTRLGQQHPVEPQGRLFDLLGAHPVGARGRDRQTGELEDGRRALLEDAVEEGVGLHGTILAQGARMGVRNPGTWR